MKRLGAVYEELFLPSDARVGARKKSSASGNSGPIPDDIPNVPAGSSGERSSSRLKANEALRIGQPDSAAVEPDRISRADAQQDTFLQPGSYSTSRQLVSSRLSERRSVRDDARSFQSRCSSLDQPTMSKRSNNTCSNSLKVEGSVAHECISQEFKRDSLPSRVQGSGDVLFESTARVEMETNSHIARGSLPRASASSGAEQGMKKFNLSDPSKATRITRNGKSTWNSAGIPELDGNSTTKKSGRSPSREQSTCSDFRSLSQFPPATLPRWNGAGITQPGTSKSHQRQKRRAQSERSGKQPEGYSAQSSNRVRSKNMARTSSLRTEVTPLLANLFPNRSKLMAWPMGIAPRVLYAGEKSNELDDGRGTGGLCATLLCKMGARHRSWDVVRGNERFCLRIVGWQGGEAVAASNAVTTGRAVVYTIVDMSYEKGDGKSVVHDECCVSDVGGYHFVSDSRSMAARNEGKEVEAVRMSVGLWIGHSETGEVADVTTEVRWRLLSERGVNEDGKRNMRPGSMLLRFGYYFFLNQPCSTRLFTCTDTPEHVRLVARRVGDGGIDEEASKALTYVVVRVSAD